jgi:hypothetical protein
LMPLTLDRIWWHPAYNVVMFVLWIIRSCLDVIGFTSIYLC